ncbi:MAG: hypothetical protein JNJ57_13995 [Saprospiraceae bacterium]|nr:hypothetical protein [Saprospiraceae bacterium]
MTFLRFFACICLAFGSSCALRSPETPDVGLYLKLSSSRIQLPNQWKLTPAGDYHLPLGDLPLQLTISPNKRWMAVTNNGVGSQYIQLLEADGNDIRQPRGAIYRRIVYLNLNGSSMKYYGKLLKD